MMTPHDVAEVQRNPARRPAAPYCAPPHPHAGCLQGTAMYCAPEVVLQGRASCAADMYRWVGGLARTHGCRHPELLLPYATARCNRVCTV